MATSDTMPFVNVARKNALAAGWVAALLAFLLVSCAGALGSAASSTTPSMPTTIAVTVPDSGWRLRVERVLELDAEVWVLAQLRREPGMAAQMIQQAKAEMPVTLPAKKMHVFVAGKTWKWPNDEAYEFVGSLEEVAKRAGSARVLYPAGK